MLTFSSVIVWAEHHCCHNANTNRDTRQHSTNIKTFDLVLTAENKIQFVLLCVIHLCLLLCVIHLCLLLCVIHLCWLCDTVMFLNMANGVCRGDKMQKNSLIMYSVNVRHSIPDHCIIFCYWLLLKMFWHVLIPRGYYMGAYSCLPSMTVTCSSLCCML